MFMTGYLLRNRKTARTVGKLYECIECDKKFMTLHNFQRHKRTHDHTKIFDCMECDRKFRKSEYLADHMKVHHDPTTPINEGVHIQTNIKLENSEEEKTVEEVKIDIENTVITPDELETVKNELLGDINFHDNYKMLNNNDNDTSNVEATSPQPESSVMKYNKRPNQQRVPCTCPNCLKGMNFKNEEEEHNCHIPGCNKAFMYPSDLKNHLKWHRDEEPFGCKFCGKRFGTIYDIQRHVQTHTGETPYQCTVCNKNFTTLYNLQMHKVSHTGERTFICMKRDMKFIKLSHIQRYKTIHSGEKIYECNHCSKKFKTLCTLQRHTLSHSDNTIYECMECDKKFKTLYGLHLHKQTPSSEKIYGCVGCDKKVVRSNNLASNMKTKLKSILQVKNVEQMKFQINSHGQ